MPPGLAKLLKINVIVLLSFQEVYLIYSGKEPKASTALSKFYLLLLFCFQVFEFMFYLSLYLFITKHNKEMAETNIITTDIQKSRKRLNLLSLKAQMMGFFIEAAFFLLSLSSKMIERRLLIPKFREYTHFSSVIMLFSINSTMLIMASSDLRKKLFALFRF